jgi:hypothetical protein
VGRCYADSPDIDGQVLFEGHCSEGDMVEVMKSSGYSVTATGLQQGVDFLTEPLHACDWIITNPPFNLADKFIARCAEHGKPFALLLKAQYWHAAKRYEIFQSTPPAVVCPLTWRPDFLFKSGKRGAPLMDVIWCVWNPQHKGGTLYCPLKKQ